jgi:flagellar biosynthesis/type III secretory pathway M-ring protein FliF/YscJ
MAAMAAVAVALIGFFAVLILRVTAPQMTPLFTDLTLEDSTAIVKELEREAFYVNDRLVARGEVVLVEDQLGITMTEIIKAERT